MDTLTNVEAQRVMAIMNEMAEKLLLLSSLPTELSYTEADVESIGGPRLAEALLTQTELEQRFRTLQSTEVDASRRSGDEAARAAEIREATRLLRRSSRNICRLLMEDRDVAQKFSSTQTVPSALLPFIRALKELRDITRGKLLATVQDARNTEVAQTSLDARAKRATADARVLQKELDALRREREHEAAAGEEYLTTLRDEIQTIRSNADARAKQIADEAAAEEIAEEKSFSETAEDLRARIEKLRETLEQLTATHRENELVLRRRTHKAEQEVENWINKFDTEMTEKQQEIESLQEVYSTESAQLQDIETKLAALQEKFASLRLVEGIIWDERVSKAVSDLTVVNAAKHIQRWIRAIFKSRRRGRRRGKGEKRGGRRGGRARRSRSRGRA